jgi:hypothetical protein
MAKPAVPEPERYRDLWRVRSRTEPRFYYVRLEPKPTCQCAAFLFGHGSPCAHIVAVRKFIEQEGGANDAN